MANKAPHWITGPVGYAGNVLNPALQWDFIGATAHGEVRRWVLVYDAEHRKFRHYGQTLNEWERGHMAELSALFRPAAVLRSDLPKGTLSEAFRAMLPALEIAAASALSITQGWFRRPAMGVDP
ncbi:hypothetical protein GA830_10475 [Mesorhizobium sp. NBSH29]|uniref:hypothetical protein n=1 Tax=Mesorhizobium sp. NBSH29 TaxID=2654249 RepID=UPI0018968CD4|nr:hypothetical protein [Mesorhizobium sp. NBSH29]QPC87119.1 hypothetical protein GA830_10475 [Mesorhizobium sp. NBSH29]